MTEHTTRLMEAEQQAHDLLNALSALKSETEGYANARQELSRAVDALSELTLAQESLARNLREAIGVVNDLDVDRIIGGIDGNQEALGRINLQHEATASSVAAVHTTVERVDASMTAQLAGLSQRLKLVLGVAAAALAAGLAAVILQLVA